MSALGDRTVGSRHSNVSLTDALYQHDYIIRITPAGDALVGGSLGATGPFVPALAYDPVQRCTLQSPDYFSACLA